VATNNKGGNKTAEQEGSDDDNKNLLDDNTLNALID